MYIFHIKPSLYFWRYCLDLSYSNFWNKENITIFGQDLKVSYSYFQLFDLFFNSLLIVKCIDWSIFRIFLWIVHWTWNYTKRPVDIFDRIRFLNWTPRWFSFFSMSPNCSKTFSYRSSSVISFITIFFF